MCRNCWDSFVEFIGVSKEKKVYFCHSKEDKDAIIRVFVSHGYFFHEISLKFQSSWT